MQMNTRMTADLPCAPAAMLAPLLASAAEDGVSHALHDIAEVADAVGAETMEVTLDCRQHGGDSVLLPGLADFQGPAICITLPGMLCCRDQCSAPSLDINLKGLCPSTGIVQQPMQCCKPVDLR